MAIIFVVFGQRGVGGHISNKIFVGKKTTFLERIETILTGGNSVKLTGEDLGQINILLLVLA